MKSEIVNPQSEMGNPKLETRDPKLNVLLIEDSRVEARVIRDMLTEVNGSRFGVVCAERLAAGLEQLTKGAIDIVLLDLVLPDSEGLDTFLKTHAQAPKVPIVVLTGLDDETLAVKAMQEGAQDYLVKGQLDSTLLGRAIRYAIGRHRLLMELQQQYAQQLEQQKRELQSLERLSGPPATSVTAQSFGLSPMHESVPDQFNELVQHYGDLMDLVLEQKVYRVEHNVSEALRTTGEKLGFLRAGPRDVVEIHSTAMKRKADGAAPQKVKAYVEEGRLMVLELMGYLASYYRNYSLGQRK